MGYRFSVLGAVRIFSIVSLVCLLSLTSTVAGGGGGRLEDLMQVDQVRSSSDQGQTGSPPPSVSVIAPQVSSVYPGLKVGNTAYVNVRGRLNFRTAPWGRIQGVLSRGTTVKILGFQGDWVRVSLNGKVGYCHGRYLRGGGSSTPSTPIVTPPTKPETPSTPQQPTAGIAKKILDEGTAQLGTRRYNNASTSYGKLACAAYVSGVLRDSGAIPSNKGSLGVTVLRGQLESMGWKKVSLAQKQPGDVIIWGPYPGGTHGHVGIIDAQRGGTWYTLDNSSSAGVPTRKPLNTTRPIVTVLRAPGA